VQQQIVDHATKLIAIKLSFGLQTKISHYLKVHSPVQSLHRIIDKGIKIQLSQIELETSQGGETAYKLIDTVGGFSDSAQYILSKNGIIKMERQVVKGQTER